MLRMQRTSRLALALLATTMLTAPAPALADRGDAIGGEFRVNDLATGLQGGAAVAMSADGDFVVVWGSRDHQDGSGWGIFAQRYDAVGVAQGPEFQVNTFTTGDQRDPSVAMDADGDFVVAWESYGQEGFGLRYGIFAKRFNSAGVAQGLEFQVNTSVFLDQIDPAVAMDADGDFIVTWHGVNATSTDIFARRYDVAGVAQGSEFQVNTFTAGFDSWSSIAMDADGDFVVTWQRYFGAANIFARRYDATGVAQGSEFQVNTLTGDELWPSVAMDADGDFVVAWTDDFGQDGSGGGIFARRFNPAGVAQGPEFQVNTFTTGSQVVPAVAMDADGDFVVAWTDYFGQDGDSRGVFAQRYNAAGEAQGAEFQVNSFTTGEQRGPAVAMDADGDFAVAWQSYGQDGSHFGVFAQRFDGQDRVEGDFDGDGNADVLWRHVEKGAMVLWLMEGTTTRAGRGIGTVPPAWQIAGTGDFNGDRKSDILWRHIETGATVIWQMDGFRRVASGGIGRVPLAWEIEKVLDTNGDGKADIVWRNVKTAVTVVWQMDGFKRVASGGIARVGPAWQVQ